MKKFFKWSAMVFGGIVLLIVVLVAGFAGLRKANFLITDETMMARFPAPEFQGLSFEGLVLKESPNQFLVCDANACEAEPHLASATFDISADELRVRFTSIIEGSPQVTFIGSDNALMQDDFIQRTSMMQYPDLITIRYIPLSDGTSTFYIYSRSVYGYGDAGVNQARIEGWLAELDAL